FVDEHENADRSLTLRYRFAHHVYHNAFFDSLRATRRVALSRGAAEVLVRRTGDQPGERAGDIALLFETARDNIRAAEYWNRAAQTAARLYAHDETAQRAQRGLLVRQGLDVAHARQHPDDLLDRPHLLQRLQLIAKVLERELVRSKFRLQLLGVAG